MEKKRQAKLQAETKPAVMKFCNEYLDQYPMGKVEPTQDDFVKKTLDSLTAMRATAKGSTKKYTRNSSTFKTSTREDEIQRR